MVVPGIVRTVICLEILKVKTTHLHVTFLLPDLKLSQCIDICWLLYPLYNLEISSVKLISVIRSSASSVFHSLLSPALQAAASGLELARLAGLTGLTGPVTFQQPTQSSISSQTYFQYFTAPPLQSCPVLQSLALNRERRIKPQAILSAYLLFLEIFSFIIGTIIIIISWSFVVISRH